MNYVDKLKEKYIEMEKLNVKNNQELTLAHTFENSIRSALVPLSPSETEIAKFVFLGLSNSEIGERIGKKEKTVKFHLTSVLKKTQTNSRQKLLSKLFYVALRNGNVILESGV